MRWLEKGRLRLRSLFRRRRVEQELNEELRFHLDQMVEEHIGKGKSPAEAHQAALRELGGVDQFKEECRDARGIGFIETALRDLRYGARMLIKNPGFTVVVALTLAVGIASTSSIFSVVDAIMLRPLPAKDPDQLVWFQGGQGYDINMSHPDYLDLCRQAASFSAIVASQSQDIRIDIAGQTKIIRGELVSDNYFSALGIPAALGRTFEAGGDWSGYPAPPVIISHGLWQRRFGRDPGIIGKEAVFDGRKTVVTGVAPPWFSRFRVGMATELWLPLTAWKSAAKLRDRQYRLRFDLLGRLRPGIGKEQARAEVNAIAQRLSNAFPSTHKDIKFSLQKEAELRRTILIFVSLMMCGVGLVLLVCCANISGMMLARAEARQRETAIRLALGAGRRRLIRQLLTENLLLSAIGGGVGLLFTSWLIRLESVLMPAGQVVMRFDIRVDARVLVFTIAITVLSALITGLAPALAASRTDLVSILKKDRGGANDGRFWFGARSALLAGQVAVSLILVVGAGMFLKSLTVSESIDPGFDTKRDLMSVAVLPAEGGVFPYQSFFLPVAERIRALPGVRNVACAIDVGVGNGGTLEAVIPGVEPPSGKRSFTLGYNAVDANYFRTVGARILRGRSFEAGDEGIESRSVIINRKVAAWFWPASDPIGRHIVVGKRNYQVVGLVEDARNLRDIHNPPAPCIYIPFSHLSGGALIVETAGAPMALAGAVKGAILSVDEDATIVSIVSMEERLKMALWADRFLGLLVGALACIGIFLTAVGLYGVVAYIMQRRTQEIGVRLAMGAGRRDVIRFGLRHGLKFALIGIPFGLGGAAVATGMLSHVLYGVNALDPAIFLEACALVLGVTLLAGYIPARRASRIDPTIALRRE